VHGEREREVGLAQTGWRDQQRARGGGEPIAHDEIRLRQIPFEPFIDRERRRWPGRLLDRWLALRRVLLLPAIGRVAVPVRGLAGVGYTLLRQCDSSLPNVLIWE